jgi:sugar-specific transcriptional regulator TrmB
MDEMDLLSKIGLSENEAKIYLTLLKLGPSSAYLVAQKTGIYRPHVYDKLETLANKSLVSHIQKGKKKIFAAAPPSKIMNYLTEQEDAIKEDIKLLSQNMQNLDALFNLPKEDTNVQMFSGVEGLKLRLEDTYKSTQSGAEILIFGLDDAKYNEALPIFMPQHFKRLKERGLRERVITQKSRDVFMFDNQVTTYRFLNSTQINPTNTIIYGDKVALVIWGTPITSIVIENKQLTRTYREYFEYLWKIAEKKA